LEEVYKFSLQKLLDIRKDKEEESKRIFKDAKLEKDKAEKKLTTLKEDYKKYNKDSENETLVLRKLKNMYLNALDKNILETKTELESKIIELDEKREELKQKQIDRKTVETLKEKQRQAFIKEQQLAEQKANDEFALYGFLRTHERR
jgi:flagellar protein FliJ